MDSKNICNFVIGDETVYFEPKDECEYFHMSFAGERFHMLFQRFDINKQIMVFRGFHGLIPMWYESVSGASKDNIDLAAENVAYLSGFKDPFYFSSVFKKATGVSPKEYTGKTLHNKRGALWQDTKWYSTQISIPQVTYR